MPAPKGEFPMTHPVEVSQRLTLEFPTEWHAVINKTVGVPTAYAMFMFEKDAVAFIGDNDELEIKKVSC